MLPMTARRFTIWLMSSQQMLAHDFGNGGGADAVTEIAVYDNAGPAALGGRSAIGRCGYGKGD